MPSDLSKARPCSSVSAVVTNVMFMPWAEKLAILNKQEIESLEIICRGILAIQSGENPRVIEQKLNTFLPPKVREAEQKEAA